ncbi:hypothetical protein [Nonomuraea endophytica]|uniref:hypothetical protein n=1 Tax=Nonomuraea endophytica TaxID=714136 RepID=UPI0037CB1786
MVTLGQGSAETAIALGIVPVGIESYAWGSDKTGYLPWIHEAVTKSGGITKEQYSVPSDTCEGHARPAILAHMIVVRKGVRALAP